jgi:prepilin-type N-terminal cleavage/methylation domain-containing protein
MRSGVWDRTASEAMTILWAENRNAASSRQGFTLLELLLVLAILVIIGAIGTPVLDRVLERQRLRGAAEELRVAWEDARLVAMRTGQVQAFACEIGGRTYSIEPLVLHDDVNNVAEGATLFSGGVAAQASTPTVGMNPSTANESQSRQAELEETLTFASCRVAGDTRAFSLSSTPPGSAGNAAAAMVYFYPDGTSSTAEVLIQSERGDLTGIQIRGLTGHSRTLGVVDSTELGLQR